MLKYYDTICEECGKTKEQLIESTDKFEKCECGGKMKRCYTKFTFKLKYDNKKDICGWSCHGYERSRYWDDVKAERAKGKDVKPFHEK